jgi:hypothetical protein
LIPDHPVFEGLIIEVNGIDVIPNMELLKEVAIRWFHHHQRAHVEPTVLTCALASSRLAARPLVLMSRLGLT